MKRFLMNKKNAKLVKAACVAVKETTKVELCFFLVRQPPVNERHSM